MSHDEGERLVSLLLDVDELPPDLRRRMLERSEGNPFFLEEIVRQLIDEGLLLRVGERWRARDGIADVEIPDTVQAVILARLDLLAPGERGVTQAAAVVGRVFWAGAVARLAEPADVDETLRTLRRRELVLDRLTPSMAGDDEYIFKHVLIRDVAYESLPRKERARLHAEAARWLEDRTGERVGEPAELLEHLRGSTLIVSTVKKSQASMLDACWRRNCCQLRPMRRGAGPRLAASSNRRKVLEETRKPSFWSSPAIRG